MAIDARNLTTPIICSVDDIQPHTVSTRERSQLAIEGLRNTATRNQDERQRAVSELVRLASAGRRVRANEDRNGGR